MKKLIISMLLFTCYSIAFAQTTDNTDSPFKIGAYAGANFSGVNMSTPDLSNQTKSGFQAGVFFREGKVLYGQAGLEYQLMKSRFSRSDSVIEFAEDDVIFHLIKLPLYAGVNLLPMDDQVVNLRIFAGPTIAYLFNVPVNQLEFTKNDFNQFRIDGSVGAGIDILIFSVDVGYNFGMNQLFTDQYDGKTHYAFVNAGVKF